MRQHARRRFRVTPAQVHVASLILGLVTLVYLNRHEWFVQDDWEFIVSRGFHHAARSIWVPHNEHWSTIPILVFRAVVSLEGVRSAWPTFGLLLLEHLGVAHLLWRVSRRVAVDPWIATGLVAVFVFLGSGAENLTWDSQIGFGGAVLLGYLAIQADAVSLRAPWRVGLAQLCCVASLMCSGIGITMTVAVGIDLLLRRGIRRAALVVSVPAAVYVTWYTAVGYQGLKHDHVTAHTLLQVPSYLWTGLSASLGDTFHLNGFGGVLVLLLLGWAVITAGSARSPRGTAYALAVSSVVLFVLIGAARTGLGPAAASRYVYVAMALLVPPIGLALTSVLRLSPAGRPIILVVLALVLVANLGALRTYAGRQRALVSGLRTKIVAAAHVLASGDPILGVEPEPTYSPDITSTALLHLYREGDLPRVPLTPSDLLFAQSMVDLGVTGAPTIARPLVVTVPPTSAPGCTSVGDVTVSVPPGGGWLLVLSSQNQGLGVTLHNGAGQSVPLRAFPLPAGRTYLEISASGTTATVQAQYPSTVQYCTQAGGR